MALEPITRQEKIIAGQDLTPITRMEKFLKEFGGSGGSGGAQPDWNAAEGEPGHILNRPFYESTEVLFDQRVEIVDSAPWMMESDIPVYEWDTVTVTFDGVEYETTAVQTGTLAIFGNLGSMGGEDNGMPFTIATGSDRGVPVTLIVAGGGTHSVKIEKMVAKPIDPKFVPGKAVYYWDGSSLAVTDSHGVPISVEKALNDTPNVVIRILGSDEYYYPYYCGPANSGKAVMFKFFSVGETVKHVYAGTIPE